MIDKKPPVREIPNINDIPIMLRGDMPAFIIVGRPGHGFSIYYMLSKGKLFLHESKGDIGSRNIKVKTSDIVCLWADQKTGSEEFCGYLDETGKIISTGKIRHQIPSRYFKYVQRWCESRRELITLIKKGKLKLSKKVLEVKSLKVSKGFEKRLGINIEDDNIGSDK